MSSDLFGLIELALIFGLVGWFGYSQLRAVRRDRNDIASVYNSLIIESNWEYVYNVNRLF